MVLSFNLALKGVVLGLALCASTRVRADFTMTNPVTGENQSYTWKYVGTDSVWNSKSNWQKSDGANPTVDKGAGIHGGPYEPFYFDNAGVVTAPGTDINVDAVEGWNLRIGVYNGTTAIISKLEKIAGGSAGDRWISVDSTSKLIISRGTGQITNDKAMKYYVAAAGGIVFTNDFTSAGGAAGCDIYYNLAGAGSVVYKDLGVCNHYIKRADVTLTHPNTKRISYKKLVSFTSSTKTFKTASDSKVYVDGTATSFPEGNLPTAVSITTASNVGTCQLVQRNDNPTGDDGEGNGVYLYYIDGPHYTADVTESTAVWSTKSGLTSADTWVNGAGKTIALVNQTDGATVTLDADITAHLLVVCSDDEKGLTLAKNEAATLSFDAYDFTGADGRVTVGFSTGAASVFAGENTVLTQLGTGEILVGAGKKLTLTGAARGWAESSIAVADGGELVIGGGDTLTSVPFNTKVASVVGVVSYAATINTGASGMEFANAINRDFVDGANITAARFVNGNESGSPVQVFNQRGGEITVTGAGDITAASPTSVAPVLFAHWPSTVTYNLLGGSLTAVSGVKGSIYFARDGNARLSIGGGDTTATLKTNGLIDDNRGNKDKTNTFIEILPNGVFEIGSFGIAMRDSHEPFRLSGGTLKAYETASVSVAHANGVAVTANSVLAAKTGETLTIASALTVSANKTLTLDGGGIVTFTSLTLNAGSRLVLINGTKAVINGGTIDDNAVIVIESGSILDLSSTNLTIGQIECASGGNISIASGKTLTVKNGGSISGTVSGSGNITLDGGTMNIASAVPCKIIVNAGTTVNANGTFALSGSNKIDSGATLNITGGNVTLTTGGNDNGIKGTINIKNGATLTTATGDALWYDAGSAGNGVINIEANGTLAMGLTRWTLGANNQINLYENATISGNGPDNGNLDLNNNNGTKSIHAYGNATISATIRAGRDANCEIIVDEGKTLTCSGQIFGTYASSIAKRGAGTLKITNASSTLPTREAGYIELAPGTWNLGSRRDLYGYKLTAGGNAVIKVSQTPYEYANGRLDICNIDSSIEHVTVVKVDSTETTLDVSAGAATMGDGTVVVGGKACTFDWEFNGDLSSSGLTANALSYDSNMNADNSFDGEGHLYIRTHPYYNSTYAHGLWTWADAWTVAIKCEVPTTSKGMVITFGNQGDGCVGLATSEIEGKVILFKAGANGAAETISEMAVADRSGSQHLYLFSKTADGKMQVYCDDTLIDNKTVSGLGALKGTLQVGSLHGGVDYINLNRPANDDPATIDFVQVYNYEISEAQRAALISNYAWVNPNQYTRTVTGDESLSSADAWTKPSDSSTVAIPVADADAFVTTSSSSAALTVNANFTAATLTVNSSGDEGAALRIKAGAGTLSAAKVEINAPVTVDIGAVDFASCPVAVADGQTLTFDVTGIIDSNWANVTSIDRVKLTGVTTLGVGASIAVSPATAHYWSLSSVEDDGDYYLTFTPGRVSQEIYWKGDNNHTYWSAGSDNTADFYTEGTFENGTKYFPGDTVVIPNASRQRWFGPVSDGANIKFDCAGSISVKKTGTLGYALKNATVTVTAGTTIKFENDRDNAPEIYGGSISGAGTVQIDDGVRATFSNGAYMSCNLTGDGEVAYGSLPTSNPTYTSWTGTVVLPSLTASSGWSLNQYGNSGSTVEILGITGGWISEAGKAVAPKLKLTGDIVIGAMSSWTYSFSEITGSGNLSFATTGGQPSSVTISKVAAGYMGTISSSLTTPVTIGELKLSSLPTCDQKILSVGGTGSISLDISNIKVGESPLPAKYKVERRPEGAEGDGFYVYYYGTIFSVW